MGCSASIDLADCPGLEDDNLHPIIEELRSGKARKIVVLVGAGISVSAGIPDFRTPGTGLYYNLQKFNLPYPKAVFDYDFFQSNPEPFTILAKELWPTNFKPTLTHFFVKLLEEKGQLLRHYTQNIDGLDHAAGIPEDKIVEAHGSFGDGRCTLCKKTYKAEWIRERLFRDEISYCTDCKGLVKPNIVFFGEMLPKRYHELSATDFGNADAVICMGTSLQVMPFAGLISKKKVKDATRILINRECPRAWKRTTEDLVLLGECDAQICRLCEKLGWLEDLVRISTSWAAQGAADAKLSADGKEASETSRPTSAGDQSPGLLPGETRSSWGSASIASVANQDENASREGSTPSAKSV